MRLLLLITLLFFQSSLQAELLLGIVETEVNQDGMVVVMEAPDRPALRPEQRVNIQTRIPGVDEVIESAQGYVYATENNRLLIKINEGEPAPGEQVVVLSGQFQRGRVTTDEHIWQRMGFEDTRAGTNDPVNPGAVCALALRYEAGRDVEKDGYRAYQLFGLAARKQASADCAARYGMYLLMGDQTNQPPKWRVDPEGGLYWVEHAAERGSYLGMLGYANALSVINERRKAKKWFKKAIEIEPATHKGNAQKLMEISLKR